MVVRNLRRIRQSRELSQKALGDLVRLPQQQISAFERGLAPSRVEHVARIAAALNVSAEALVGHRAKGRSR